MNMPVTLAAVPGLFRDTYRGWADDKAARLGAAISYYTVFSLAPLLLITIAIAGFVVGGDTARTAVVDSMGGLVGTDGGKAIEGIIDSASKHETTGIFATIAGIVMLVFGATGVFVELQDALNTIWGVEAKKTSGLWGFLRNRMLSFAMVVAIGFLLLVSLVITAGLSVIGDWMSASLPGGELLWQMVNFLISLAVTAGLFAAVYKVLPDVKLTWPDVVVGATVTALLFTLGKFAIGLYLGKSSTVSVFGAAGSLAVIFVWVYYSAQILLFGAEFTWVWANRYGSHRNKDKEQVLARGAEPLPYAPKPPHQAATA